MVRWIMLCILVTLPACTLVPPQPLHEAARLHHRAHTLVYDVRMLPPGTYRLLGAIDGLSCQAAQWHDIANTDEAIDHLRLQAAALGGNGVTDVRCEPPGGVHLTKNCWSHQLCQGQAIALP